MQKLIYIWWNADSQLATLIQCGEIFLAIKPDNVEGEAVLRQSDVMGNLSEDYCRTEILCTEEYWEKLQSVGDIIDNPECKREIERLRESEELAWGLIANAYGGDWELASEASGWKIAAERWRDAYHATLPSSLSEDDNDEVDSEAKEAEKHFDGRYELGCS